MAGGTATDFLVLGSQTSESSATSFICTDLPGRGLALGLALDFQQHDSMMPMMGLHSSLLSLSSLSSQPLTPNNGKAPGSPGATGLPGPGQR